jgi:hypothetical protein
VVIGTISFQRYFNNEGSINFGLAYSERDDQRNQFGPVTIGQARYQANDLFLQKDQRLSLNSYYKIGATKIGIKYLFNENFYDNKFNNLNRSNGFNNNELIPYFENKISFNKKWHLNTNMGALFSSKTYLLYEMGLSYIYKNNLKISYRNSLNHQNFGSFFDNSVVRPYVSSYSSMIDIKYTPSKFSFSLQSFLHNINNAPVIKNNGEELKYYNGLDGIDYYKNLSYEAHNKKYNIRGVTGQVEYHDKQFWINSNATLYGQSFKSEGFQKYGFNINFGKDFNIKSNNLSLSSSYHWRSAQPLFDINTSIYYVDKNYMAIPLEINKPYMRIDARLVYTLKNSLWSLDIQNVTGKINNNFLLPTSNNAYMLSGGLGTLPVLTWKRLF